MADRLEESVEIIRRDRDRSRDFLADVSHELRTPIAALRTFNELLARAAPATTRRRAPSSSIEPPASSSGSTGSPRTCSSSRSSTRGSSSSTCGRTTCGPRSSRPSSRPRPAAPRRGVELDAGPARRADPDPPRSAADRPGRHEPRRQRDQVHAAGRRGRRSGCAATTDGARIEVADTGVGIDASRAAPDLRAVLSRLAGERGARQRQRPRPGDRPVDRRHARRPVAVESVLGAGTTFTVTPAGRSADRAPRSRRVAVPLADARPLTSRR